MIVRSWALAVASVAAITAGAAPASVKPCRDASGRVIACVKPKAAPLARCKDAQGRFVSCKSAAATPPHRS